LFKPLAGGRVQLVCKQDLLPQWVFKCPGSRRWWLALKTAPVRGWILQQVVKLAVAEKLEADGYLYADSDVVFVRPFDATRLWRGSDLRLFRSDRIEVMLESHRYLNWYRHAARYAGSQVPSNIQGGYIAQLNSLRRDRMLELFSAIENASGKPWQQALLGTWDFSEYILYGAYAEYARQFAGHYADERQICHSSWFYSIQNEADLQRYLSRLEPHHVAVHIQSNLHISTDTYRTMVSQLADQLG